MLLQLHVLKTVIAHLLVSLQLIVNLKTYHLNKIKSNYPWLAETREKVTSSPIHFYYLVIRLIGV